MFKYSVHSELRVRIISAVVHREMVGWEWYFNYFSISCSSLKTYLPSTKRSTVGLAPAFPVCPPVRDPPRPPVTVPPQIPLPLPLEESFSTLSMTLKPQTVQCFPPNGDKWFEWYIPQVGVHALK